MAEGIGLLNQRIVFYTMGSNPISSAMFFCMQKCCFQRRLPPNSLTPKDSLLRRRGSCFSGKVCMCFGDVVQLVERMLCKHEVTGSSPVISIFLRILKYARGV